MIISLATIAEAAVFKAKVKKECMVRPNPARGRDGPPGLFSDVRIMGLKPKEPAKSVDIDVRMFYPDAASAESSSIQGLLK